MKASPETPGGRRWRHTALRSLIGLFDYPGLRAGGDLVRRLAPLPPHERIDLLVETVPWRLVPVLVRYRDAQGLAASAGVLCGVPACLARNNSSPFVVKQCSSR